MYTDQGIRMSSQQNVNSNLHKEVILPLLVGVRCFGFYLYGTPLIYTQEINPIQTNLDQDDFSDMDTISDDLELPRFGSVTPGSIVEL